MAGRPNTIAGRIVMSIDASSRAFALKGGLALLLALGAVTRASALEFSMPIAGEDIQGTLNTTLTAGVGVRMQNPSSKIIGKGDLNPNVCAGTTPQTKHYSCQGVFKNQFQPAALAASAPGAFTGNSDDGDLNYKRYDLTSGVAKITQDLSLKWKDYGLFLKGLYFYDFVNNDFTEHRPNMITPQNKASVAQTDDLGRTVYPLGAPVAFRRSNSATLRQIGSDLQLLDAYFYGKQSIFDHEFTFKVGRQLVNWGESTLNVIGSINSANPVNANNFYRVGMQVEEVFQPVGMVFLSTDLFEGATVETFYQYEWQPLEAPAAGSFYSGSDIVGTNNGASFANLSFGTAPDDPYGVGFLQDNPLSGITPSTLRLQRVRDDKPKGTGQYGIALKYYADWLNNGTGLGLYYENYHSRLPFASAFATRASCARAADAINGWDPALSGNALNINATDTTTFGLACSNIPLLAGILFPNSVKWQPGDPTHPSAPGMPAMNAAGQPLFSDAVPLDTAKLWIEYPRDIHLLGASFNTTVGSLSLQGEVAYRPNAPLQVNPVDVIFAAMGPTLSACHRGNCTGTGLTSSAAGQAALTSILNGTGPIGQQLAAALPGVVTNAQAYGPSDFDPTCLPGACDTFTLVVGHADGSRRSFPNFILPYRGRVVGENSPTDFTRPYDRNNPGYIQGYERFKTLQFDLGATQVLGASDFLPSAIAADQILILYELGANLVPGLPSLDRLQITSEGGAYTSATAGADGSGADGSRQACAGNTTDCVIGPDGLRFNPHQAPLSAFATKFAWGYNIISLVRYESVLPGISIQSQITIKHDVNGNAPGPGENFLGGRKIFDVFIETRYKSSVSFGVGYNWITGGGDKNLLADRDAARAVVKYQF
ncbi:MAG: DUF1302 family protein [Nevskiaceae bacterium]|nr:MAG: DUF1302 family protein [Nevskiaceae bacterium]